VLSAVIAVTVGKIGSNMNYFFELIAASCIATGLALHRLRSEFKDESVFTSVTAGALLVQLVLFLHAPFLTRPTPTKYDRECARKVSAAIQNTTGDIIAEDAGLLLAGGKQVLFQPFELTQLSNQGLWDQSEFVNDIRGCRFPLVILSFDAHCDIDHERLTVQMAEALRDNYRQDTVIGEYHFHVPVRE
jgi:hypothetical protein